MQTSETVEIELQAFVDRVTYRNEENGYTVVKLKERQNDLGFTGVGCLPLVRAGEELQLFGQWVAHKSFGNQFKIDRAIPLRPSSRKGIVKYLSSGLIKGVGPKTAEKIVRKFGESTLDILDNDPERLKEVKGLTKKLREGITASWSENKLLHEVMLFLTTHNISPLFAMRIFKVYGLDAIEIVKSNPYQLSSDIAGIGFKSSDLVAKSLGIAPDSEERVRAGIIHQMQCSEADGHCYLTQDQLLEQLQETLSLSEEQLLPKFVSALTSLEDSSVIILEEDAQKNRRYYLRDLIVCETNIAKRVAELLNNPISVEEDRVSSWLQRFTDAAKMELSQQQIDSVIEASKNRLFILTGGPGVGKTTVANTIIRLFKAMSRSVALCAPTGRAAQRLTEVSGFEAKTIHRLLEWNPSEKGFLKDENNPLSAQVVICDESSMLDVKLADALFRSLGHHSQLILIGDVDQLPSVGAGNVLRDLIESHKVPFSRLDQIFRQAATSKIVSAAHKINQGICPDFNPVGNSDCQLRIADSSMSIKEIMKSFICGEAERYGFDPVSDVQILTPMNRGELGTQALNSEIQEIINPKRSGMDEFKRGSFVIRPHDKVIQIANNYDLGVFNGDIGIVRLANVDDGKIIVQFGDRQISYTDEAILDLRLAYAITIHKAQGSEFPVTIIPVSMQHFIMLQRNLYYTALTRAKKLAIFIGTERPLQTAVRNHKSQARQTGLIERISETSHA